MLQLTGTKAPRSLSVGSVEKFEAGGSCAPIASATHGGDGWVQRASARAQVCTCEYIRVCCTCARARRLGRCTATEESKRNNCISGPGGHCSTTSPLDCSRLLALYTVSSKHRALRGGKERGEPGFFFSLTRKNNGRTMILIVDWFYYFPFFLYLISG